MDSILGEMRCLDVLSEWPELTHLANMTWPTANNEQKQRMSRMAASASWGLGQWEQMEEYVRHMPAETSETAFFSAVLQVHKNEFHNAQNLIDKARALIDNDLTAMAGESYSRAYGAMVQVQMLSELEEVIQYKLVPERRDMIKQKWWQRFVSFLTNIH